MQNHLPPMRHFSGPKHNIVIHHALNHFRSKRVALHLFHFSSLLFTSMNRFACRDVEILRNVPEIVPREQKAHERRLASDVISR